MTTKWILGALFLTTLSQVLGQGLGQWFQGGNAMQGNTGFVGNLAAVNAWNPGFRLQGLQPNPAMLPSPAVQNRRQGYSGTAGRYPVRGKRSAEVLEYTGQMVSSWSNMISRNTKSEKRLTRRKRQAPGPAHMQAWDFHPSSLARARLQASLNERKPASLGNSKNSTGTLPRLTGSEASVGPVRRHPTVLKRSQSGRRLTRNGGRPTLAAKSPSRPKNTGSLSQPPRPTQTPNTGNLPSIATASNPVLPTFNGRRSHHDTLFPNHPMDAHAQPPMKEMRQRQPIDQVRQPILDQRRAKTQSKMDSSMSPEPTVVVRPKPTTRPVQTGTRSKQPLQESPVVLLSSKASTVPRQESPVSVQPNPPLALRQEPPIGMAPHPPMALRQEPPMGMAPHPPMALRQEPPMGMVPHPPMALRQEPPIGVAPHPPMALRQDPPMGMAPYPPMALRQEPPMGMKPHPPMALSQEPPIGLPPNPPMPQIQKQPMGKQQLSSSSAQTVDLAGLTTLDPLYEVQGSVANDHVLFPNSEPSFKLLNDPSSQTIPDPKASSKSQNTGALNNLKTNLNIVPVNQQLLQQQTHEQHMLEQQAQNRPSPTRPPRNNQQQKNQTNNQRLPKDSLKQRIKPMQSNKQGNGQRKPNHHNSPLTANQPVTNQEHTNLHASSGRLGNEAPLQKGPLSQKPLPEQLQHGQMRKQNHNQEMIHHQMLTKQFEQAPFDHQPQSQAKSHGPLSNKHLAHEPRKTGMQNPGSPIETALFNSNVDNVPVNRGIARPLASKNLWTPVQNTGQGQPIHTDNHVSNKDRNDKGISVKTWFIPANFDLPIRKPTTQASPATRKPHLGNRASRISGRRKAINSVRRRMPTTTTTILPVPTPSTALWWPEMNGAATIPTTMWPTTMPTTRPADPVTTTRKPTPRPSTRKPRPRQERQRRKHRPRPVPVTRRPVTPPTTLGLATMPQTTTQLPAHTPYRPRPIPRNTRKPHQQNSIQHPPVLKRNGWGVQQANPYRPHNAQRAPSGPFRTDNVRYVYDPSVPAAITTTSRMPTQPQPRVITRPSVRPPQQPHVPSATRSESPVLTRPRIQSHARAHSPVVIRQQPPTRPQSQIVTRPKEQPMTGPQFQVDTRLQEQAQARIQSQVVTRPPERPPTIPKGPVRQPSPIKYIPVQNQVRRAQNIPSASLDQPSNPAPSTGSKVSQWDLPGPPPSTMMPFYDTTRASAPFPKTTTRRPPRRHVRRNQRRMRQQPARMHGAKRPPVRRQRQRRPERPRPTQLPWLASTAVTWEKITAKSFTNERPHPTPSNNFGSQWSQNQVPLHQVPTVDNQTPPGQKSPLAQNKDLISFLRMLVNDTPARATSTPRPTVPAAITAAPLNNTLSVQSLQNNELLAILRKIAHGPGIKYPTPNISSHTSVSNTTTATILGVTPVFLMPGSQAGGTGAPATEPSLGQKNMRLLLDALAHNQQKTESLNMIVMNLLHQAQHPPPQPAAHSLQQQTFDPTILNILSLGGGLGQGLGQEQSNGGLGINNLLPEPRSCVCFAKTARCPPDKKQFVDIGECGESNIMCCDDN